VEWNLARKDNNMSYRLLPRAYSAGYASPYGYAAPYGYGSYSYG
jgi:hypothetical protein